MPLNSYLLLLFIWLIGDLSCGIKFKTPNEQQETTNEFWYSAARADLDAASSRRFNNKIAKNVIIFVGDGMGISATTAGRIYKGQKKGYSGEEDSLEWENFPNHALTKTYNLDKQVPDSAGTATAIFGGVKSNFGTIGVNGKTKRGDCKASLEDLSRVTSILQWCQEAGKETGIITTTRITHATPASLYAHSADRTWECDAIMPKEGAEDCKDIARQLTEDLPGKNVNVIFAGGRRQMGDPILFNSENDTSCVRNDSRNLAQEWLDEKLGRGASASYVKNSKDLRNLDVENTDFIMGLFEEDHLPYEFERNNSPDGTPSLEELTELAIKRLSRNENGYFLMVEGGRIDHALHHTKPFIMLEELLSFERAVAVAMKLVDEEETLVIVTADHSHVLTINGYPERGNDILGITMGDGAVDKMPYTTLMFTNGFGANYSWDGNQVIRANLTGVDTRDPHFMPQAAVLTPEGSETHAGEDIATYAIGPSAHLFQKVHEQPYIAHVMGFAACVGPYNDACSRIVVATNKGRSNLYYDTLLYLNLFILGCKFRHFSVVL